jgi:hypothetical protein
MTTTPHPPPPVTEGHPERIPPPPPRRPVSPVVKVLLFVIAPLLVLATAAALVAGLWPTAIQLDFRAAGAPQATISVPDAQIELLPSGDGEVHVEVTGWYSGSAPEFAVATEQNETVVRGGCWTFLLSRCSLTVTVALPATADVRIAGTNGSITASRMTGSLDIDTTNGALRVTDAAGVLDLRTTNGWIQVRGATSPQVSAFTTNGEVELDFTEAPDEAIARSTNGGITVRVPAGEPYFIDMRTTNGQVQSGFESDRTAERTITAETTNGNISVERADG